jgi:hypothetical protein
MIKIDVKIKCNKYLGMEEVYSFLQPFNIRKK